MKNYQMCTKCVLDTTDIDIEFDDNGVCNYCRKYPEIVINNVVAPNLRKEAFKNLIEEVKHKGKNKKYDCIIGLSGGVDSTYVAIKVKEFGLRPLAIHVDNGWNTELSEKNMRKVIEKLEIDLYTEVLDWEQFKDLQLSFLKASVPDLEIPTDHAITAVILNQAKKNDIEFYFSGANVATEYIMPPQWSHGHSDWKYIQSIHNYFGTKPINNFPRCTFLDMVFMKIRNKLKIINLLDYLDYNKEVAMNILEKELGWEYYGGKHYESIYTRFIQGYILPKKFGFDKRKGHLSCLINSNQLSRDEALIQLKEDPYPNELLEQDKELVIQKLGLSEKEFQKLMNLDNKFFIDYPSYERTNYYQLSKHIYQIIKVIRNKSDYRKVF